MNKYTFHTVSLLCLEVDKATISILFIMSWYLCDYVAEMIVCRFEYL